MGLKEDVLAGIAEVLGKESAEQIVKNFDDPKKYPKDFLDEYLYFMQRLIGDAVEKKVSPLYKKYKVKHMYYRQSSISS